MTSASPPPDQRAPPLWSLTPPPDRRAPSPWRRCAPSSGGCRTAVTLAESVRLTSGGIFPPAERCGSMLFEDNLGPIFEILHLIDGDDAITDALAVLEVAAECRQISQGIPVEPYLAPAHRLGERFPQRQAAFVAQEKKTEKRPGLTLDRVIVSFNIRKIRPPFLQAGTSLLGLPGVEHVEHPKIRDVDVRQPAHDKLAPLVARDQTGAQTVSKEPCLVRGHRSNFDTASALVRSVASGSGEASSPPAGCRQR